MHVRATGFVYTVPLLVSGLLCVVQSSSSSPPATRTITATIEDLDSGQPLSNTKLKVGLFPPEHGARKLPSLLCVPSDDAQPLLSFDLTTDQNGAFSVTAPGGPYLAKITVAQRQPIFGCVFFDTESSIRTCPVDPSSLRMHQHLFIRTAKSIPGFSGDILSNSACAPYQPQPCDPLRVPNLVTTAKVLLVDPDGEPMRDARLEFSEYTKGKGKQVASLAADASGAVDVSSLLGARILRMSITSEHASGEFLIEFSKGETPGQQTIKLFHWRCRGNVMLGVVVQP